MKIDSFSITIIICCPIATDWYITAAREKPPIYHARCVKLSFFNVGKIRACYNLFREWQNIAPQRCIYTMHGIPINTRAPNRHAESSPPSLPDPAMHPPTTLRPRRFRSTADPMPPRRCDQPNGLTRFRGIRWHMYGTWAAELMTGGERV
jgi:hypothetical protein